MCIAGGLPCGADRADGLGVPDADGDPGAVRGRVPPAARALPLHLRPRAHLCVADRGVRRHLQPAALLRGGARRRHHAQHQRHRLHRDGLGAAPEPSLHHHLPQLVLPAGHVLCPIFSARHIQLRHLHTGQLLVVTQFFNMLSKFRFKILGVIVALLF